MWNGVIRENSLVLSSGLNMFEMHYLAPRFGWFCCLLLNLLKERTGIAGCRDTSALLCSRFFWGIQTYLNACWCLSNFDARKIQQTSTDSWVSGVGIQGILRVKAQCFKKTLEKAVIPLLIVAWIMLVVVPLSLVLLYKLYWVNDHDHPLSTINHSQSS